jgi:hypothetical protein
MNIDTFLEICGDFFKQITPNVYENDEEDIEILYEKVYYKSFKEEENVYEKEDEKIIEIDEIDENNYYSDCDFLHLFFCIDYIKNLFNNFEKIKED